TFKNDNIANNFYDNIHAKNNPSIIIDANNKKDFYFNPLSYEIIKSYDSISLLLDDYYFKEDLKSKVKAKTGDLLSFVNKQIAKYTKKLEKLDLELIDANDSDKYRIYGELLLSNSNLKNKLSEIEVFNYYTSENIKIKLDNKITVLDNSNKYFKKYQKAKSSIKYINEQIEEAHNEIDYFTVLKYQLIDASINEALEIQDELIENKYLFNKEITNKKKNQKPKLLTYEVNNTLISVGKNNIQNEYLTHKLSNSNDMWFHVKDAPGSHVVIHSSEELSEELIRTAANLAAYYSAYKESSSVPVDYTRIRNIKKIPKRRACFVTYKHQSTIYIDPDMDAILKLKIKK
ncbi:MAG: NFACT RNA binding domain-containing protein, partial [Acholeplasmatales bacterium]|nr:NFACT RNA binding domain-containing protein [Acholeplasmatales bacterium]